MENRKENHSVRMITYSLLFVPVALLFLYGCAKYSYVKETDSISGVNTEGILFPLSKFSYYKQEAYRGDVYIVYFSDMDFYELNKDSVYAIYPYEKIDPKGGANLIVNFEKTKPRPPFDFNLEYRYFRMDFKIKNVSVDGLYNEENNILIIRMLDWRDYT